MKILYDYQIFDMQRFGGISNSFVKLIENLPNGIEYEIALRESDNIHLIDSELSVEFESRKLYEGNFISTKNFKGKSLLYRLCSKLLPNLTTLGRNRQCSIDGLKRGSFDIFHPTFFDPYFLQYINNKPFVLTVHDMIPEKYFQGKDLQKEYKKLLCDKASHIVVVSNQTKQDLIKMLNIPDNKISVVYHGAPLYPNVESTKPIVDGRYFLYVGQRNSYKNFIPMVKGLAKFLSDIYDIKLICTGPEFTEYELLTFNQLGISQRIKHIYANDSDMYSLYANALCFIYPSLYEGFGIPILEAYSAHCPILLNHTSCFPEIAQDAAIYFHLDNKNSDLEFVMDHFLSMTSQEKQNLIEKQNERLMFFSWEKASSKLAQVYKSV